ncbi:hypothetical protein DCE79_06860 [Lysinibacillus sp. 2017]|uniref:DUF3021 family protein n=1 Tax=unclassified Lysinibacillus TaxID=2636778 RepID=UPI000D525ABC|nr:MULTISPECIES: DUF3021 family protein [unclassified Lysinibacillus]AWE07142.1 hypothetical protein DCE79_06860 [Lysinibacillus sp. 2017]TGN36938.1 DUF3021 domain-containing protein [Lysinibacillus sp. S2017]
MRNFLISCFVSVFTSYFTIALISFREPTALWAGDELIEEFLLALALGLMIGCANNIFKLNQWPYIAVLAVHYIIVVSSAFTIGIFGSWFSMEQPMTIVALFIRITIIYIIVWLFILMTQKKDIKRMNEILQESRGEQE